MADWCPASRKFFPTWEKIKNELLKKNPSLQISDLNVKNDPKLSKIASDANCKEFPTIMLFCKGKSQKISLPTSADTNGINSVVNNIFIHIDKL